MWGNPWKSGIDGTREEVIQKFKCYFIDKIKSKDITKAHLEVLRGARLGCTCYPKQCHGDVIAEIVNKVFKDTFTVEDL